MSQVEQQACIHLGYLSTKYAVNQAICVVAQWPYPFWPAEGNPSIAACWNSVALGVGISEKSKSVLSALNPDMYFILSHKLWGITPLD